MKPKILAAYEKMATAYNDLIDHKPHNAYYDRPATLRLLPDVERKSILDAACGPGKYAEILLQRGATVTGVDMSPSMIRLAKERNAGQGTFYVHDLSTPLTEESDESYDIVICALALHYIEDWTVTIEEFYRVLKRDGLLVISIEHPFFEYLYFQSENYFQTESVHATWSGFGEPIEVYSYRRSLSQCIAPLTDSGFLIDAIVEPKPTEEFKHKDPKHYEELNRFPSFMMIRALKPSLL